MIKPRTSYSEPSTPIFLITEDGYLVTTEAGDYIQVGEEIGKSKTSYTGRTKSDTSYTHNSNVLQGLVKLNSMTVTLDSLVYRLNGYTTALAPNQLSNKQPMSYS